MADELLLNPDGTVTVTVNDEGILLKRPKIGQFRELCEAMERADAKWNALSGVDEWPENLKQAAADIAVQQLGSPTNATQRRAVQELTVKNMEMLLANHLLQQSTNPYPEVWQQIILTLGGKDVSADDLPAWMVVPMACAAIREHWMAVPLRLGGNAVDGLPPTTQTP